MTTDFNRVVKKQRLDEMQTTVSTKTETEHRVKQSGMNSETSAKPLSIHGFVCIGSVVTQIKDQIHHELMDVLCDVPKEVIGLMMGYISCQKHLRVWMKFAYPKRIESLCLQTDCKAFDLISGSEMLCEVFKTMLRPLFKKVGCRFKRLAMIPPDNNNTTNKWLSSLGDWSMVKMVRDDPYWEGAICVPHDYVVPTLEELNVMLDRNNSFIRQIFNRWEFLVEAEAIKVSDSTNEIEIELSIPCFSMDSVFD